MVSYRMQYSELEKGYKQKATVEHRKKYAQFFTPEPIAQFMARWIAGNQHLVTVLDPSFGLGVLAKSVRECSKARITGYEVDRAIADYVQSNNMTDDVDLRLADYLYSDWAQTYDGIICNPPYFKFHDYDNKAYLKEVESHLGCHLSGFTNFYALFLLKSICQLNPNGRCAYIVPSEFLNADYGVGVKQELLKSKRLRHVIVFDFSENIFEDALTTACIILCANDEHSDIVRFSSIHTMDELENAGHDYQEFKNKDLNPAVKWKRYYAGTRQKRYKHLVPFSKYAKVMRGIATGDNKYFTLSASKARKHHLTENDMVRCVCRSVDVQTSIFTQADYENLKERDKTVYLFNATADLGSEPVQAYIRLGEAENVDKRYLTSQRSPWYALENRKPSPIWVSVFSRSGLRFVRNEANVYNLTTFHCVYPTGGNLFLEVDNDLLFAYLQTDLARNILLDNCREYGNGLRKFEPNDINKGMMADIDLMPLRDKLMVKQLYNEYKATNEAKRLEEIEDIFRRQFTI